LVSVKIILKSKIQPSDVKTFHKEASPIRFPIKETEIRDVLKPNASS